MAGTWTNKKKQLLIEYFNKMEYVEMAERLGMGFDQVKTMARRLGLKKEGGRKSSWPKWAEQHLLDNYKQIGDKELALQLTSRDTTGKIWTHKMIERRRCHLGITRTEKEIAAILERNVRRGCFVTPKAQKARRSRGYYNGKIVIQNHNGRKVLVIKWKGEMVHLNRWMWEQLHGPIPEGMFVVFKDGNQLNCVPENLDLISMSENGPRNKMQWLREADIELYDLWKAKIKLNQAINNILNNQ